MIQRRETPKQWDSAHCVSYIQGPTDTFKTQLIILILCSIYLRFIKLALWKQTDAELLCSPMHHGYRTWGHDVVRGSCADILQQQISCPLYKNVKVNCALVQALRLCTVHTAHRGSRGTLYSFLATALEGGEGSASRPGRFLPSGKTRYPLYRRLGGPQCRSGQVRKISPPPGFDPGTVQPVARRYTEYATRPAVHDTHLRKNNCANLSISESCIDTPSSFELAVEARHVKYNKLLK